ncbi:MAG: glycosyltransferase family 2 protein [Candidatus Aenigmarchaeota archaeon]|nr:glycosyltransferase family 2 protein [Candidatus Aenigmarchaeota archaeon]
MADIIIDIINSIFALSGIYFTVLFIFLFFHHEKKFFKTPRMEKFPSISIIIPAFNEQSTIASTIKAVKAMTYPKRKEIIVVDDGSKDNTFQIAKKIKGIKVFTKKNNGKASALNFGLKKATGEIVVCVDSDSYPEKNALLKTVPFFQKDVAAVTSTVLIKDAKKMIEKLQDLEYTIIAWSRKIMEYLECIYVTPGPMSLYKRKILLDLGGFDEKNITEDIEIAWRLLKNKYKIKMALDAKVYTHAPKNLSIWWHQRIRWNIGGMQTFLKYIDLFFSKDIRNMGMLLLPLFSISYVLNFVGFGLTGYIISKGLQYLAGAYMFGFNPFNISLSIIPDMFFFLAFFSFSLAMLLIKLNFDTMKKVGIVPVKVLDFLVYLFIYILLSPLNLLDSTIRFLTGKYRW